MLRLSLVFIAGGHEYACDKGNIWLKIIASCILFFYFLPTYQEAQRSLWLQIGNKPMSKPAHAPAGVMHEEGGGTSGSKDEGEVSVGMQQERRQGVPVPAEGLTMQQTQQQQQKQQQRAYGVLDKLYLLLFTTIFCGAFVSTVFYWYETCSICDKVGEKYSPSVKQNSSLLK
jgi:hypothetical protein